MRSTPLPLSRLLLLAVVSLLLIPGETLAQSTKAPFNAPKGYDRASDVQPEGNAADFRVRAEALAALRGGLTENFDDVAALPAAGWALQNNTEPLGATGWFQGNPTVFPSQAGADTSYIAANFQNGSGTATISNWLLTPEVGMENGTEMTFFARSADSTFPDRLQVRLSTAGGSTNVGSGATDVGDFTELLLDINPNYEQGVFLDEWTEYTVTVSGLSEPVTGRFAFRYFVENGGTTGANSDFIGIDEVSITAVVSGPPTAGGPDAFGYTWVSSNNAEGPVFGFVDISGTGTALDLGDDASETVALPFTFSFYGQDKTEVMIGSNGYLTFGTDGTDFSNDAIPNDLDPNDFIAPFWDDLDPGDDNGIVYWQDMGDGRFIVQYDGVPDFPGPGEDAENTFQVILSEDGNLLFQYADMNGELISATVGIENADATDGLAVAVNEEFIENGLAVLIEAPEDTGGEQVSLPITFEEDIDYELVDFGGASSMLAEDPEDSDNTVVETVRPDAAECFAGTTVANATGFDMPIPFEPGETKMTVRVWSPAAGVRVRFKVEKFDDPTISVEADEFTTVAMGWETLEYDFVEDQVPNTAPINFDAEYTKASIFFNFQCDVPPTSTPSDTYYWDDIAFGPADMSGGEVSLNEFRVDMAGPDDDEFFEITGEPGMSLDGLTLLVIGDGDGGQGVIENVTSLDGQSIPDDGFFVAAEETFTLGMADFTTSLNFENGQSSTYVLVSGFSGMDGDDLDPDDDGTPDVAPWSEVVDAIGIVSGDEDDIAYGEALGFEDIGPNGDFTPAQFYRAADTNEWVIGEFELGVTDTPGEMNLDAPLPATVTFDDQTSEGLTVVVASVFVPMDGYVAIHDASLLEGNVLGSVIGVSEYLEPGTYTDLAVTLFNVPGADFPADTSLMKTQTLIAMPHQETSGDMEYSFLLTEGGEDGPYFVDNDPEQGAVIDDAVITIEMAGALSFDPSPLVEMLNVSETGTETVTITNNTGGDVAFDFSQYSGDDPDPLTGDAERAPAYEEVFEYLALAKGDDDPRVGEGQRFDSGGPDAFGYQWIDSNEPGGPVYEWVDISETGAPVVLGDDEGAEVELPFTFSFYGEDKSTVTIGSNGYLTFGTDGTDFSNDPIPTDTDPNDFIAPFWDDLDPGDGVGEIFFQAMGDGRFVVQYEGVPPFPGPGDGSNLYTFQVILDASGSILYQYEDMIGEIDGATIGIENADATDGLQVAFNEAYVENGLAVLIRARPNFVTDVTPATGTIPAGGSVDVNVDFSAEGLNGGTYEGNLTVDTDLDSDPSTFDLPVVLEVTGMAVCAISPDPVTFDDTIVGFSTSEEVAVSNGGTDSCELTDASADAPFSVEDFEATTLAPGEATTFTVVYTPTESGDDTGTLTVSSSEGDLTASLEGTGLEPPSFSVDPTSLSFQVIEGDVSDAQAITLSNTGDGEGEFTVSVANATRRGLTPSVGQVDPIVTLNAPETAALIAQIEDKPIISARMGVTVTAKPGTSKLTAATQQSVLRGGGPGDLIAQTTTVTSISGIGQAPDGTIYICDLNAGAQTETFTFDGSSFTSTGTFVQPGTGGTNITGCTYFPDGDGGNGALWYLNANLGAGTADFIETDLSGTPTGAVVPVSGLAAGAVPIGLSYNEATGQFFLLDIAADDIVSVGTDGAVIASVPQTCLDDGTGTFGNALDALGDGLDVTAGTTADGRPTRVQVTEFDGSCRGDGEGNDLFTPITVTEDTFVNAVLRDRSAPNEVMYIGANSDFTIYAVIPVEREDIGSFLTVDPEEGTVDAGGDQEISVVADASDLEPGTYTADIVIETNDPANPVLTVSVTVEVMPDVANEEDGVPTEFALSQNYPNPFASATTIEYALPEASRVTITVYDAVGRRVAVLVDEDLTTGYHKAEWDTRGLASGVYLYRIQAGDFVKTKKMSLVR